MSILSELGKFFGEKHAEINKKIEDDKVRIESLEQEISELKTQLGQVSLQFNDIKIIDPDRGLILMSEDYHPYRIRITKDKKLIIDDITTEENHVREFLCLPSGSTGFPIGNIDDEEEEI